nr:hypothetical protein I308_00987 [Cryptococcus tetragattii IND107]
MYDTIEAFPLCNYLFIEREGQPEEDNSVTNRLKRLEDQYKESGTRRSVEAIMVVTVGISLGSSGVLLILPFLVAT